MFRDNDVATFQLQQGATELLTRKALALSVRPFVDRNMTYQETCLGLWMIFDTDHYTQFVD